ncbi:hypothetical protein ACFE04_010946 [Oxalis oulophora]
MASRRGMVPVTMVCLIVSISIMFDVARAEEHIVGGDLGWIVPPKNISQHFFSNWSHSQSFKIHDVLVFKWGAKTQHTVLEVTRADYECCSSNNPLETLYEQNPTNITLTKNGTRYFICTISSHCKDGQKVAIHVGTGTSLVSTINILAAVASSVLIALLNF